jgi:hypothetical protein
MNKWQNISSYLLGRFNPRASSTSKPQNIVHREKSHTLRWSVSSFFISPTTTVQKFVGAVSTVTSTQQSLFNRREYSCFDVSEHARHWSNRNYSLAQTQWSFSLSRRYTSISKSYDATTILTTHFTRWISQTAFSAITTLETHVRQALPCPENYFRYGFYRSDSLWEAGTCHHRLQSNQTWASVLSPSVVFRWYHQRLHSRRTAIRQHLYIERDNISSRSIICQDTDDCKTRFYPRRQRVFRSRDHRKDRRTSWGALYHCGKINQPDQETALFVALPYANTWNPNGRVSLSTKQLEEAIPVYCDSTSNTGGSNRTTHTVFFRQVQLPSDGNKHETHADQHLAFLQWSRWSGAYYQRTQKRLSISKDTDKTFFIERIVFSHPFVFV